MNPTIWYQPDCKIVFCANINVPCDFVSVFATNRCETVQSMVFIVRKRVDISYLCRRQFIKCKITK